MHGISILFSFLYSKVDGFNANSVKLASKGVKMKMAAGQRKEILLKIGTVFFLLELYWLQRMEKKIHQFCTFLHMSFCMTNFSNRVNHMHKN